MTWRPGRRTAARPRGTREVRGRHVAANRAVHLLVLEEQHRVVVPDRRAQEPLGVVGRGRDHDLEPRDVGEERLHGLRVVQGAVNAAAERGADHHRHRVPPQRAVAHPRRLGHDLVEGREDEVGELDLGDRPQPVERGTDRGADDHRLRQRRVDHAVVAELGPQAVGRQEDPALPADVLAEHDDRCVAAHLLGHAVADRLDERPDRHQPCPTPPAPPAPGARAAAPRCPRRRRRPSPWPSPDPGPPPTRRSPSRPPPGRRSPPRGPTRQHP